MATEEGVPNAHQVSEAFVTQYYPLVGKLTHEAHRLYVDASVVSRPGPDGTMISFTSIEDINKHFLSCDTTSSYEVLTVDSQSSLDEGIFIMVIGFLIGEDSSKRKFSQMFYLARQNAAYVVVNDIFRYVDDEVSSTPAAATPPAVVVDESETVVVEPVHAPAEVKNVSEVKEAATPLDNGSNKHPVEEAVTAQKPRETVAETAAPPPVDGAKKSFAAMVASMARSSAPFQVKAAPVVQKPRYVAAPPPKPREAAASAPKAPAAAVSKRERRNDQRIIDEPGTSIFVSNLPMDAMPPQLHELFKEFGSIKEHGVQVRSSTARGTCFGFVAFETVTSVQSVLEAAKNNPFKLGDRKLRVKEKQVEYDGSKPTGGRKTENGSSADGSKPSGVKSGGGGSKSENGSASADGSKTENGSAADAEDDFKPIKSRKNRSEKKGNGNEKSNVQTAPKPKA
ncbi:Nuclear transport factor 2 [Hirschfeldia incana]|nr:Nuclear transport factor 2 [Hirschfeldia incana]